MLLIIKKRVIFLFEQNAKTKKTLLTNDFLHSYFPQILQKILEKLYTGRVLLYLLNNLNSGIFWQRTNSKLVGIFSFFCSCAIFVYSIFQAGLLLRLCRFHHCNLDECVWPALAQTGSQRGLTIVSLCVQYLHAVLFLRGRGEGGGWSIPNALNFEKLGVKPHNRGLLLNVFALFS